MFSPVFDDFSSLPQVVALLGADVLIFPTLVGWALDVATLPVCFCLLTLWVCVWFFFFCS